MKQHLNPAVYALRRSTIREFSALAAAKEGCIRLTLGEPEFNTPAPVGEALKSALANGQTHYIANNGAPALLQKIAEFEKKKNGFEVTPEQIIVTAGSGGYFPSGLVIGTVEEVYLEESGITCSASIRPAVEIDEMSYVFIITEFLGQTKGAAP